MPIHPTFLEVSAVMAELVDALDSGSSRGYLVKVRVFLAAKKNRFALEGAKRFFVLMNNRNTQLKRIDHCFQAV